MGYKDHISYIRTRILNLNDDIFYIRINFLNIYF